MVNIVSRQPHPSVVKECLCKNCGSTLSYTPSDVKKHESSDYLGDVSISYKIICPVCEHNIFVAKPILIGY